MTVSLFVSIFVGGALMTVLLTQAIKQFYYNRGAQASPNIIALINALVVGGLGTAFAYMLMDIPWILNNILCLIAMIVFVWMGSMLGYSKILQTIQQFQLWRRTGDMQKLQELLEEAKEKE